MTSRGDGLGEPEGEIAAPIEFDRGLGPSARPLCEVIEELVRGQAEMLELARRYVERTSGTSQDVDRRHRRART